MQDHLRETGYGWPQYLDYFVEEHGGWAPLSDVLIHRARRTVEISPDPQTVEKGLRRLAQRGHGDGGQYGRWMLRFFGMPANVAAWLAWMGQYHSRFFDLPTRLRAEQLRLWDREPVLSSAEAVWVHLGQASLHMRWGDTQAARSRLTLTQPARCGAAAEIEVALFEARLLSDDGDREGCARRLEQARDRLEALEGDELDLYRARTLDQLAYQLLHPAQGPKDIESAEALYLEIATSPLPFVAYRRASGLAYCRWRAGAVQEAVSLCREAIDHAGDGGFVRLRVMALNMLSRILEEPDGAVYRERAERLATQLEDEDLLARVKR